MLIDLRVDDHTQPITELQRIYALQDLLFGRTPRGDWLTVDDGLRTELTDRLTRLGYDGGLDQALPAWAGTENLESRIDGVEQIDPVVLRELRAR